MIAPATVCSRSQLVRWPSGCSEHLQRKRHVQQADPARRVPGVNPRRVRRALGQQRARRRILRSRWWRGRRFPWRPDAAFRAQGQEVRCDNMVIGRRRRALGHPLRHQLPQPRFPGVGIKPQNPRCRRQGVSSVDHAQTAGSRAIEPPQRAYRPFEEEKGLETRLRCRITHSATSDLLIVGPLETLHGSRSHALRWECRPL